MTWFQCLYRFHLSFHWSRLRFDHQRKCLRWGIDNIAIYPRISIFLAHFWDCIIEFCRVLVCKISRIEICEVRNHYSIVPLLFCFENHLPRLLGGWNFQEILFEYWITKPQNFSPLPLRLPPLRSLDFIFWKFKILFFSYFKGHQKSTFSLARRLKIWGFTLLMSKSNPSKFQPPAITFKPILEAFKYDKIHSTTN